MKTLILLLTITISFFAEGFVKDPVYDDLSGAALVRALLKDGKLDLAHPEILDLQKQNSNEAEVLLGQWHYLKGDWKKAQQTLASVKTQSLYFEEAQVWLGRTHYQAKNYESCASVYSRGLENRHAIESDLLWKSHCELKLGQKEKSWRTLLQTRQRFATFQVESEWITRLVQLQLVHEGLLAAIEWFTTHSSPATHFLNLAEIFQSSNQTGAALVLLEMARAQHPIHQDVNLAIAQIYFQKGLLMASEEGFQRAALTDGKYYYHTAELNRQTRRFERSLYFNASVQDEKERLKQKIATYVDANKYSLIASLDAVIQRSELQKDDEIRYALAYSLVRTGDLERPLKYLSQITKPELIQKTTVLRQTLLDCREKQGVCHL